MEQPASAYFMEERHDPNETHTLSVIVQNEPGVLARVIGLFSGRGYNIESLTVSETEHHKHMSRITIVTTGTPMVIQQIKNNSMGMYDSVNPVISVNSTSYASSSAYSATMFGSAGDAPDTLADAVYDSELERTRRFEDELAGCEPFDCVVR